MPGDAWYGTIPDVGIKGAASITVSSALTSDGSNFGAFTAGTSTGGIQEAINAALAATSSGFPTSIHIKHGTYNLTAPIVIAGGVAVSCDPGTILNQPAGVTWNVVTKNGGSNFTIFICVVGTVGAPNTNGTWTGGQFTTANGTADTSQSAFVIGGNVYNYTIENSNVVGLNRYDVWLTGYVTVAGKTYDGPVSSLLILNMYTQNCGTTTGSGSGNSGTGAVVDGGGFKLQNNSTASNFTGISHVGHTVSGAIFSCYDTNSNQGTNTGISTTGFSYTMLNATNGAPVLLENPLGGSGVLDSNITIGPGTTVGGVNGVSVGSAHSQTKVIGVTASGWGASGAAFIINPGSTAYAATSNDIAFIGCSGVGAAGGANTQVGFKFAFAGAFSGSVCNNVLVANSSFSLVNTGILITCSATRQIGPVVFVGVNVGSLSGAGSSATVVSGALPAGLTGGTISYVSCTGVGFPSTPKNEIVVGNVANSGYDFDPGTNPTPGDSLGTDCSAAIQAAFNAAVAAPYNANSPAVVRFVPGAYKLWNAGTTPVPIHIKSGRQKIRGSGRRSTALQPQTGPATAITVTASPFTYTNASGDAQQVQVTGGTVSVIKLNGTIQQDMSGNAANATSGIFNVQNTGTIQVTYTVAPTMTAYLSLFVTDVVSDAGGIEWEALEINVGTNTWAYGLDYASDPINGGYYSETTRMAKCRSIFTDAGAGWIGASVFLDGHEGAEVSDPDIQGGLFWHVPKGELQISGGFILTAKIAAQVANINNTAFQNNGASGIGLTIDGTSAQNDIPIVATIVNLIGAYFNGATVGGNPVACISNNNANGTKTILNVVGGEYYIPAGTAPAGYIINNLSTLVVNLIGRPEFKKTTNNATPLTASPALMVTTIGGVPEIAGVQTVASLLAQNPANATSAAATVFVTGGNPTGQSSATMVMAGLAAACSAPPAITPVLTGKVKATFSGNVTNSTLADGWQIQARQGTGTAPLNNAAATGNTSGSNLIATALSGKDAFCFSRIWTGLALGTAIWIDLAFSFQTAGGTVTLSACDVLIEELPA